MKLSEYQRSRSFFDLGRSSFRFQNLNLFFSETIVRFGTKVHVKRLRENVMKIYINELGHMTNMATMSIYDKKNFKNRLFQNR